MVPGETHIRVSLPRSYQFGVKSSQLKVASGVSMTQEVRVSLEPYLEAVHGDHSLLVACHRCHAEGIILDFEPPQSFGEPLEPACATCYDLGWIEERGSSPWYAKTRVNDPVLYALRYEQLGVSIRSCPNCSASRLEGESVITNTPYADYMARYGLPKAA